MVSCPVNFVDDIRNYCFKKVAPVKACYFQKGTPRYFEYEVLGEGVDKTPTGDTDGYIQLIFSSRKKVLEEICELSERVRMPLSLFVSEIQTSWCLTSI